MSGFALETALHWAGVALYIAAAVALTFATPSGRAMARRAGMVLAALGLVPHAAAIVLRWIAVGHGPYMLRYEVLSSNAWVAIAVVWLLAIAVVRLNVNNPPSVLGALQLAPSVGLVLALALLLVLATALAGCSIQKMATKSVADSLTKGPDVFGTDDDPELVRDALRLAERELAGVDLRLDLTDSLPVIQGDSVQLQQLLVNLITNACKAMDETAPAERRAATAAFPGRSHKVRD